MELQLTDDEATVLRSIIDRALGDAREEVFKTETLDIKDQVRRREALIATIKQKLGE